VSDETSVDQTAPADTGHDEEEHPRGTLLFLLMFLALTAAMWIWMYVLLFWRG
jgi:hypothetical protein